MPHLLRIPGSEGGVIPGVARTAALRPAGRYSSVTRKRVIPPESTLGSNAINQGVTIHKFRALVIALVAAFSLAFAFSAILAQSASAQGPGSALCDRYPELPQCQDDDGDDDGDDDDKNPSGGGGNPSTDDDGPSGNLPFTGYPLGALTLLLVLLLVAGLTLRAYLAVRDRIAGDGTTGP